MGYIAQHCKNIQRINLHSCQVSIIYDSKDTTFYILVVGSYVKLYEYVVIAGAKQLFPIVRCFSYNSETHMLFQ